MGILKCDGHNGYRCVKGVLFEDNVLSGTQENKGPCPVCLGTVAAPPVKLQLPNQPVAVDEPNLRQITNNIMGHIQTPTNPKQKEYVQRLRDIALEFYVALHDAGGTDPNQDRFANRNMAIAATDIEVALMHAVKGVCARK